jgi:hypothetical protein
VEEVGDDAQQAEPAGEEDKFIFLSKFLEDLLLELLSKLGNVTLTRMVAYKRKR